MMPRYRNRPRTIEAVQFDPDGAHRLELPEGVTGIPSPGADNWAYEGNLFFVTTIQGRQVPIKEGEWIVTEADGVHHYPIKADQFEKLYEPDA
jgi:hypothetical protein